MVDETDVAGQEATRTPRDRSPAYPFISLGNAIERLAAFDTKFGRHPAPADKAGLAWKMKEKSSQAFQTLAALKSFGLLDYKGVSAERVAFLTDDGRNYLRAQQTTIKREILKRCALRPKAINFYWQSWGADRPIDAICLDELVIKGGFTSSAADTFLRVYDDTVAFAGLTNGDTIEPEAEVEDTSGQELVMQTVVPQGSSRLVTQTATHLAPAGGFLDESYPLDGGRAFILRRPESLSAAELDEFDDWVSLLQRKMKRLAKP